MHHPVSSIAICSDRRLTVTCRVAMLLLFLQLTTVKSLLASHAAGADIAYQHLGGLQYRIILNFYRDCGGVSEPQQVSINCRSLNGNHNLNFYAYKDTLTANGTEITLPCPQAPSTCNGGTTNGIRKWTYSTTLTLPSRQSDWVISNSICCRNCIVTTIHNPCAANSVQYVEAELDNLNSAVNHSPLFANAPVAFVCLGQTFNFNHGATDPDGDSLSFSLITPKTGRSSQVTFLAPATTQQPLASSTPFLLDNLTGSISFTPSMPQVGVMAVKVTEFRNGTIIGSVIRDMQAYTVPCQNNLPSLSGINGGGNYSTSTCAGSALCFNVNSSDPDTLQVLSVSAGSQIPGSSITISAGIRPQLTFCWTPDISDIRPTPYVLTVHVRDNSCPSNGVQVFTYSIFVTGPQPSVQVTHPSCPGRNDGRIEIDSLACTACDIVWDNGITYAQRSGLGAGSYILFINDSISGCSITDTIQITEPDSIRATSTINHQDCSGFNTGAVFLTVNGGYPPYAINWSNGSQGPINSALIPGIYNATISDQRGCVSVKTFEIENRGAPLQLNATVAHAGCSGLPDGSISLTVTGGHPPYIFQWLNGFTGEIQSGLDTGSYAVSVFDSAGCRKDTVILIERPISGPQTAFTSLPPSCHGMNNGSITTIVTGTGNLHSYQWSTGATTSGISGLYGGTYTVTISAPDGCLSTQSFHLSAPSLPLNLQVETLSVTCSDGDDGSITTSLTGGTPPYSFQWSTGGTSSTITGLKKGQYIVTVTDLNGCILSDTFQVEHASPPLQLLYAVENVRCKGEQNGSISLSVSGGVPPYTCEWNTGLHAFSAQQLAPGTYTVTAIDSNGCSSVKQITVHSPSDSLTTAVASVPPNCAQGQSGLITLSPSGGTPPYQVLWNTGSTQSILGITSPGSYSYSITDSNGCTLSGTLPVADGFSPYIAATEDTEICPGEKAELSCTNCAQGQFQWYYNNTPLNGANAPSFITPASGTYHLTFTNDCGIYRSNPIEIVITPAPALALCNDLIICPGEKAMLKAEGGITYSWKPEEHLDDPGSSAPEASPEKTTVYTVTATNEGGCTATGNITVTISCDGKDIPNGISPNGDGINDFFVIDDIGLYPDNVIFIYNRWGNLVYKKRGYDNTWNGRTNTGAVQFGEELPEGTYFYILDLGNNGKPVQGFVVLRR